DSRRNAGRRHAVHPLGRDRGAMGPRRRDRRRVAAGPCGVPELCSRDVGPALGRRPAPPRRPLLAAALMAPAPSIEEWSGTDGSISEIESELARLRCESADEEGHPQQRTSVMTHVAWVPPEWLDAAERVLEGLRERHPSRTVILVPRPGEESGI